MQNLILRHISKIRFQIFKAVSCEFDKSLQKVLIWRQHFLCQIFMLVLTISNQYFKKSWLFSTHMQLFWQILFKNHNSISENLTAKFTKQCLWLLKTSLAQYNMYSLVMHLWLWLLESLGFSLEKTIRIDVLYLPTSPYCNNNRVLTL